MLLGRHTEHGSRNIILEERTHREATGILDTILGIALGIVRIRMVETSSGPKIGRFKHIAILSLVLERRWTCARIRWLFDTVTDVSHYTTIRQTKAPVVTTRRESMVP